MASTVLLLLGIGAFAILRSYFQEEQQHGSAFCCGLIALLLSLWLGWSIASNSAEKRAVKEGHAEYYLDEKNERKWRWLSPCYNPGGCVFEVPAEYAK